MIVLENKTGFLIANIYFIIRILCTILEWTTFAILVFVLILIKTNLRQVSLLLYLYDNIHTY